MKPLLTIILTFLTLLANAQNIGIGKTASASSAEASNFPANSAIDGNVSTRWSSLESDPQWISIDLGSIYTINRVKIVWEAAFGADYQIQTSLDNLTWTTIKSVTGNNTLTNDHTGLTGKCRYVRMYGTKRATSWGYSMYEFEVYGIPFLDCSNYQKTIDSLKVIVGNYSWIIKISNDTINSLRVKLDKCMHPVMDSAAIAEILKKPVGAFILKDSAYNTNMIVVQKFYNVVPTWKFKTIYQFPVNTTEGIKVKELTFINE